VVHNKRATRTLAVEVIKSDAEPKVVKVRGAVTKSGITNVGLEIYAKAEHGGGEPATASSSTYRQHPDLQNDRELRQAPGVTRRHIPQRFRKEVKTDGASDYSSSDPGHATGTSSLQALKVSVRE
jgi:hypothetical protein